MSLIGKAGVRKLLRGKINKLDVIYTDTYEIAVKNGFEGTIDEWLKALINGGIASIEQTTTSTADNGKNVITITLADGTKQTFTVENGSKGNKGDTPVRGKDYWTEEDQNAIKQEVTEVSIAEYGLTTFAEMEAAYNAGKVVFCYRIDTTNNACYIPMTEYVAGEYMAFARTASAQSVVRYSCTAGNVWQMETQKCPTPHAESHAIGGSDPITPASIGAVSNEDFETWKKQLHTAVIITQETSYEDVLAAWNAGHKHIILDAPNPNNSYSHYIVPLYSYDAGGGFTFRSLNATFERTWMLLEVSHQWAFTQKQIPSIEQYNDLLKRVKELENN